MSDPSEDYKKHAERYKKLMDAPDESKPIPAAVREWRMCCMEEKAEMKKAEKRLTFDQKKELGLLFSQKEAEWVR